MINNENRYNYVDENNNILFTKVRLNNPKSFYSEREIDGKLITNLEDTRKVLYQLPQVLEAIKNNTPIFICEGERDVETLMKHGLIATTTHSTSFWISEFTEMLKHGDVIILFDYDKTGFLRRDKLIQELAGKVKQLRSVDLPGLEYTEKHGQDITDWLEMGHTIEALLILIEKSPNIEQQYQFKTIGLKEFVTMTIPKREMLLSPIIPSQGLTMLFAKRGVGKTYVSLEIAFTIATGGTFLRWNAPEPKNVLYIDGEMPQSVMQERLQKIMLKSNQSYDVENEYFHLLTPDQQDGPMPDLSTQEGRDAIDHLVEKADFIIVDNISCLFRTGGENDSEGWQEAQSWALDLRRRGKSILFVHHAGKSGHQRGTSKKEDILDTVIMLKQPDDYKSEQGAYFEIVFDKARHFSGQDATSFIVQLIEDDQKKLRWEETISTEDLLIEQYSTMKAQGFSDLLIQEKMNRSKSQVETIKKKAKVKGLIG